MSSPTGIQSGTQLLAPAPAPAAPMATTSSGTPLTLSTSSTTMTNSSHDPSLRRQPTPAPARAPVETRKISKTTDTNNPQWKMLNQYRVIRLLGRGTHGTVKYGEDMSKDDPKAPDYAVVSTPPARGSSFFGSRILFFPALIHPRFYRQSRSSRDSQIENDSPGLMAASEPTPPSQEYATKSQS